MPSVSTLRDRLRHLAPEALAFGVIGVGNTLLYLAIYYVAMPIGPVKASVLGTVITTTLAYLANRYWTYRNHPRTALRREYTLFFGFNLIGMLIQSGMTGLGKYGLGLSEHEDKLKLMAVTMVGIVIATLFRFWSYRTFVFLKPPVDGHEGVIADMDATAGLAELSAIDEPGSAANLDLRPELDPR
ncbi:MAG TPA: GtrA family protein [Actinoplanes sp.]|nr:GtrA family protein [Actinoplanes sp.]